METIDKILDIINRVLEENNMPAAQYETAMASININSITFVKIIVSLEEAFGFEFEDEMLLIVKYPTIGSIIDYANTKIPHVN